MRRAAAAVLALLLFAGCTSEEGFGPCSRGWIPMGAFEACFLPVYCEWAGVDGDRVDACVAANRQSRGHDWWLATEAVKAGRASYDPAEAARCAREMAGHGPDEFDCGFGVQFSGTPFVTGLVADGGECRGDFECQGGRYGSCEDASFDGCTAGVCVVQPESSLGGPCQDELDHVCVDGLHCSSGSGEGVCVGGAAGTPCTERYECDYPLTCLADVCAPPLVEGDTCVGYDDCRGDLACVPAAGGGLSCQRFDVENAPCPGYCLGDFYCERADLEEFGVCRPQVGEGESCTTYRQCLYGLYCGPVSDVCRRPGTRAIGESCEPGDCAVTAYCSSEEDLMVPGVCKPDEPPFAPCRFDNICDTRRCSENSGSTLGNCLPDECLGE